MHDVIGNTVQLIYGIPDQTRAVMLTAEELKITTTECMELNEILIPGCNVQLTALLAEGMLFGYKITMYRF